jgi:F0F1-type ATP synthase delta subunit
MRVHDYTESVYALYKNGMDVETLISNLKMTLTRKGHVRLLPAILADLKRLADKEQERSTIFVTLAHKDHQETHKEEINNAVEKLGGTSHTVQIDPTITGGFIATGAESRIDRSYKKQLLTIYRSLIT